jgi:two-component system, cell cycle sensor histidine kinase and response regulator CckA
MPRKATDVDAQLATTPAAPRILLVEDETALRQMLARVLRREGYDLVLAANGSEAVALTDEDLAGVDLLVSDLIMPGASGADVAAHVRARVPNLNVMFISGCGDHPVLQRVLDTGETVLNKPFRLSAFSDAVHHALGSPAVS